MRGLLLLLIVAATLPMAFVRPIVGLILWIGFSYMNPHRIAYGFAISFPWVMITALATMVSMAMNNRQCQRMPMTALTTLLVLFLLWTGLSAFLAAVKPELAHPKWIEFFKIILMAFVTLMLALDRQRLDWIIWAIVLSFGFWGVKSGLFTILTGGGYHVIGPAHSFFHDNNEFALVMCMTLPLMRYLQLREERRYVRYGFWAMMGLTAIAVFGTYSRGGFLALGAVGLMLILKSRRRFSLLLVGIALVGAMAAFMPQKYIARLDTIHDYKQNKSAMGRIYSWEFATHYALSHPLFGGGFSMWASDRAWNTYGPPGADHRAIHSIFFEVLGEQGFVGLGLFLGLIWAGWRQLARVKKIAKTSADRYWMGDLAGMMQVSLVGFLAAGAFLPMPYFDLFYQLLALAVVLGHLATKSLRDPQAAELEAGEPGFFSVFGLQWSRKKPPKSAQPTSARSASAPRASPSAKSARNQPAQQAKKAQAKPTRPASAPPASPSAKSAQNQPAQAKKAQAKPTRSASARPASAQPASPRSGSAHSGKSGLRNLPRW